VASKGLLDDRPPDAVMAVVFCLGAVLLAPVLLVVDLSWLAQPRGLAVALHLGLVATAAAYFLFGRGLVAIPVAAAVTLSLAEPLTAGTLGVVLLGEQLTTPAVLGIGLILGGLVLLSLGGRRRSGAEE
jgi:DME family drug/metabolite transporter